MPDRIARSRRARGGEARQFALGAIGSAWLVCGTICAAILLATLGAIVCGDRLAARRGEFATILGQPVRTEMLGGLVFGLTVASAAGLCLYLRRGRRRQTEQAHRILHEWQQIQQLFLDNMPQGVFWKDRDLVYLGCNRMFAEMAGFSNPEEIVGLTDHDMPWPPEQTEFFRHVDREVIDTDKPVLNVIEPLKDSGGADHWHQVNKVPLHDVDGSVKGVLGTYQDVTDYKLLEERIHQSEKLKSIGQLAGGVAHDFNNMLAGIMGMAELLLLTMRDASEESRHRVGEIISTAKRAGELTQQLLAFSRKARTQSIVVGANTLVQEVASILRHSLDRRIVFTENLATDAPAIKGDPAQLQNALLNLAVNARDAMPDGGSLILSTALVELDNTFCRGQPFEVTPGKYVEFSVADSGVGMPPEVIAHIFEPFYTTKEPGRGTGLGLAAVYGTVKDHHGCLTVQSEPNRGTVMKILLPASELPPEERDFRMSGHDLRGQGRILLADDEELVRTSVMGMLENLGYEVALARNGLECCERFERDGPFDVVVLDLVMPVMNGHDAFRRIRSMDRDARILIASGFSLGGDVSELMDAGAAGFLQKPYRLTELAEAMASAMPSPNPLFNT